MKNLVLIISLVFLSISSIKANDYPNIAVVNTNSDGLIGVVEKAAANIFYMNHPDVFDFLFVYTSFAPTMNMQQGLAIEYTVKGINREGAFTGYGPASAWGSAGRLIGAARMVNIDMYPDDPDAAISTNPISPYAGMTHIELLAHEWSHYWLASLNFKKEGMNYEHTGLRGWEDGANNHWSGDFMSGPSVMYGGDITDNGDGTFTYQFSNPKKYGQLDLYTMGFIPPEEVGELFFLCKSEDINQCTEGDPSVPAPKTTSPSVKSDRYKHTVTIDDIIRVHGEREPASENAPKHFNIAFILVAKEGFYPLPHQFERLEQTRVRFQEWFSWATGGRATVCTELDGDCSEEEPDEEILIDEDESIDENTETPDDNEDDPVPDSEITVDKDNEKEDKDIAVSDTSGETYDDDYGFDEDETGCGCTMIF
ncbi:MAG TPA: hypothetical protein ENN58_03895 [bacterium]|nr:hypothetical protein [bacterium]